MAKGVLLHAVVEKIARKTRGGLTFPCLIFLYFCAAMEVFYEDALTTRNLIAYGRELIRKGVDTLCTSQVILGLAKTVLEQSGMKEPTVEVVEEFTSTLAWWYAQMRGKDFVNRERGSKVTAATDRVTFRARIAVGGSFSKEKYSAFAADEIERATTEEVPGDEIERQADAEASEDVDSDEFVDNVVAVSLRHSSRLGRGTHRDLRSFDD